MMGLTGTAATDTQSSAVADQMSQTRTRLLSWLMAEGWKVKDGEEPSDAAWLLVGEDDQGRRIVVGQKVARPEVVIMQVQIVLSGDHAKSLDDLEPAEREALLWEMRFFLLKLGVEFSGIEHPLRQVTVSQHFYLQEFSQNDFVAFSSRLRNALLAVVWMLNRCLSQPPMAEIAGTSVN